MTMYDGQPDAVAVPAVQAGVLVFCDNEECTRNSFHGLKAKDKAGKPFCKAKELNLEKKWEGSERNWRLACHPGY